MSLIEQAVIRLEQLGKAGVTIPCSAGDNGRQTPFVPAASVTPQATSHFERQSGVFTKASVSPSADAASNIYCAYYGLKERPFSIQTDPDFIFLGLRHTLAYAMLEYGIQSQAQFTVISGEIGCGKTTLIRHLLNNIGRNHTVGLVTNTHKDSNDLLDWIMLAFGQPYAGLSRVALFDAFQQFLIAEYRTGRQVVLIIDEAQNLNTSSLEGLRMLSNINAEKHLLLQMILVGQPQLKDLLRQADLRQFAQRVSVDFHITPLASTEVEDYIKHRLAVAGRNALLFTPKACEKIALISRGIPRCINTLCETAMVYGFSAEAEIIDLDLIDEVVRDKIEYGVFTPD
ncbi:ExeA family protein [Propionivibrio sp.]|uniref:ExeA family protein n=1 Tax=Propionivibrio sp. TaxID=2212460 RepID=UPI003BF1F887